MPRKGRIDAPGALHHVIVRGIERRKIFRSDYDRKNFLNRLGELIPETQTDCFAWAMLQNHAHLLLRTGLIPVSVLMSRLLTGYAVWFNKKYRRHGQLFQNRYKSILCQEDPYLKELVRYIHLNPLRAGVVEDMNKLDKHPWCGHSVVMNKTKQPCRMSIMFTDCFPTKKDWLEKGIECLSKKGLPRANGLILSAVDY